MWLQHRVVDLEREIQRLQGDDTSEDPEYMIRGGAGVRLQESDETKYLGPSSGTQITRLVMSLAKQFADVQSIKDIVPDARARQVQDLYTVEASKPTSKVYPLISSVAAVDLPNRDLTNLLYQLYCLKVQPMYPALHEPTLAEDIEAAHEGSADAHQNFVVRMVVAISLQKLDTQYAGLADSYYLAALKYMQAVVNRMDLKTLQACALIAQYSLLTPTRTAVYYIAGLAIRLVQTLGIHEEANISRNLDGSRADALEIDMRRRVFWCIFAMEAGLSHALGRPMGLSMGLNHFDVSFFELCDDTHITRQGILPGARPVPKKWIAIHFFKMRLLQLEIRRKLYLRKRPTPRDDQDPWFAEIQAKLDAWRDASPDSDGMIPLNKVWFIGRYNTMIAFLYRPSPQVPRPSLAGAIKCFEAAKYNIYMTREQIEQKNVDLTWIFTQAIFMAINTMLWSLSYEQVRLSNPRVEVQQHLSVGMEAIMLASDRWPGVASAHALYGHIIEAILKIYDKDGDVPISTDTSSDVASLDSAHMDPSRNSRMNSPASSTASNLQMMMSRHASSSSRTPEMIGICPPINESETAPITISSPHSAMSFGSSPNSPFYNISSFNNGNNLISQMRDEQSIPIQFQSLPDNFADISAAGWTNVTQPPQLQHQESYGSYMSDQSVYSLDPLSSVEMYTGLDNSQRTPIDGQAFDINAWFGRTGLPPNPGLNMDQQSELMQNLQTNGVGDIEMMIAGASRIFNPPQQTNQ